MAVAWNRLGIAAQLYLLVAVAIAPLCVALGLYVQNQYEEVISGRAREAAIVARAAAARIEQLHLLSFDVLKGIAQRSEVRAMRSAPCDEIFTHFLSANRSYANLLLDNAQGDVICNAAGGPNLKGLVTERAWFKRLMATGERQVGDPTVGQVVNRWIIALAEPVVDAGVVRGALVLTVDLWDYQFNLNRLLGESKLVVTVLDVDGRVILHSRDAVDWVGRKSPLTGATARLRMPEAVPGRFVADDAGAEHVYGHARVPGADWIVLASVPKEVVLEGLWVELRVGLLLVVLLLALSLATAYAVARRIRGPLVAMAKMADAVGQGQYDLRLPEGRGNRELAALAQKFNEMSAARGAAGEKQALAMSVLAESENRFRVLFEQAGVGVAELEADTARILRLNRKYAEIFGFSPDELLGKQTFGFTHPDDIRASAARLEKLGGGEVREYSTEKRYVRKDGAIIWTSVTVSPLWFGEQSRTTYLAIVVDITERKNAQEALRIGEANLRAMSDLANVGILIGTREQNVFSNPYIQQLTGYTEEEIRREPIVELFAPAEREKVLDRYRRRMQGAAVERRYQSALQRKDGGIVPVELNAAITIWDGEPASMVFVTDITERVRAEQELRVAAIAFESQMGVMVTDARGVILRVNQALTQMVGYSTEELVGNTPRMLKSNRHDAAFYAAMWESIRTAGSWQGEIWDRRKDGSVFPKLLTITAVKDGNGTVTHYVGTHADLSEIKAAESEINSLAFYDGLTRLPNRRLLRDRLGQALAGSARSGKGGALLFIDLDNFKMLNDAHGHTVGDGLLVEMARRIQTSVRQGDTVARLGGDEFMVLLEDVDAGGIAGAQAETVANKILDVLAQPYRIEPSEGAAASEVVEYQTSASIGATLFGPAGAVIDELLKQAELAMYRAKQAGRNVLRFYDPGMQAAVAARSALETDLRESLRRNHLTLLYQPQVSREGALIGAEALVRWHAPRRGMVSPTEFIPLAEETGLIVPLGRWVLEAACTQLSLWGGNAATADLTLSVNVSARQFRDKSFVDDVLAVLKTTGANPKRLKLELTESMLVDDVEETIAKMSALRTHGVGYSLDDFGTGYSSLYYLKRLPLDQLKIDASFVREVIDNPNDAAIARMIVALGNSLGLMVIAEGVETDDQKEFLAVIGCGAYQGYLFGRPGGAEDLLRLL